MSGIPGSSLTSATAFSPSLEAIKFTAEMYNAARDGKDDILMAAVKDGLNPNLTNEAGNTLLMLAAYNGHHRLVRQLIEHGGDPNRLNDRRQSPLAGAVFKKFDDVINALLDGGADPDYGTPSAMQCITMFKQEDKWRAKFEAARGKGQAKDLSSENDRAGERMK